MTPSTPSAASHPHALRATLLVAAILGSSPAVRAAAQDDADALPAPNAEITRGELEHHVRVLASDAMDGRGAATEGSARAARYLVHALESMGLGGGAGDGSFLQPIPALVVEHTAAPELIFTTKTGEREHGVYGRDFTVRFRGEGRSTEELPIVRVVMEADVPDHAQPDKALLFRGTPRDRNIWLGGRGQGKGEAWGIDLRIGNEKPGKELDPPAPARVFGPPPADECELVLVRGRMRESLLWKGYTDVQLVVHEERRGVLEHNVVAILPGTDPERSKEIVVLHAPYDHIGPPDPGVVGPRGDRVRNGASFAAGTAALLEIAQQLVAHPPARTTMFLFTSAMANARYGAEHFLEHPTVPLDSIVTVLSIDRIGFPDEETENRSDDLWLLGLGRSNVGTELRSAGISVGKAPYPDARMDNRGLAIFAREKGVLWHALFCTPPDVKIGLWRDEAERIDYDHVLGVTRTAAQAVELVTNAEWTPEWRDETRVPGR